MDSTVLFDAAVVAAAAAEYWNDAAADHYVFLAVLVEIRDTVHPSPTYSSSPG